jgi:outer membrane protein insertion porin family
MRLSPFLVAVLAASTSFVWSDSASAQTAQSLLGQGDHSPIASTESDIASLGDAAAIASTKPVSAIAPTSSATQLGQAAPADAPPPNDPSPSIDAPPEPAIPTPQPDPTPSPVSPTPVPSPQETPTGTPTQPTPPPAQPTPPAAEEEPRVLVAEVVITGADPERKAEIERVIRTQPGRTVTKSELQQDINAIFATGFFSKVEALPEDTPLGVRVTFTVQLNPVLRAVQVDGKQVLPDRVIADAFGSQYGQILNLVQLQAGVKKLNDWYQQNGYVLAQILDAPVVGSDGTVTLQVAEGVVESIQVRFLNKDGEEIDPKTQQPVKGRTRDFIITREFQLKPGDVFNRDLVQRDLQRAFGLGIFEDIKIALAPGQDPRKVTVVTQVIEKNTGSIAAGAGISSASGLFGTVSYQQQNVGGNNQKFNAEVQLGEREFLFDLSFTDPWIGGDPYRTSYTFNIFRRRTISLVFDGGDPEVRLPNGDRPRVLRTGVGLSFTRPLSKDVFKRAEWVASVGIQYQRVLLRDQDGDLSPIDSLGNQLSFSGTGEDDLLTLQLGVVRDRRDDPLRPTRGSVLRFGTEQSIPIGSGNIFFNRLRGGYSFYIPTRFLRFTKGCQQPNPKGSDCPQLLAFNVQGGTVVGDLPPYEAFILGGANSVRGYEDGDLAASRSFIQATVEYRFPVFSVVSGALFVDAATDLGSQNNVIGNPGGIRNKPGSGFGYGIGVRVQSPLGPIRLDYAINDEGDSRIQFGIGERF